MTEKEAWERILRELEAKSCSPWLCHRIAYLRSFGSISIDVFDSMSDAINAAREELKIHPTDMELSGLWGYNSPDRIAWVKKQIKRLEKSENVSL